VQAVITLASDDSGQLLLQPIEASKIFQSVPWMSVRVFTWPPQRRWNLAEPKPSPLACHSKLNHFALNSLIETEIPRQLVNRIQVEPEDAAADRKQPDKTIL
jgi:hypothetical protein